MNRDLLDHDAWRKLAADVLQAATADSVRLTLRDASSGVARFANQALRSHQEMRATNVTLEIAFGSQRATVTTQDVRPEALCAALARAEALAKAAPEDGAFAGLPSPARPLLLPTFRRETAEAGPTWRVAQAGSLLRAGRSAGFDAAGYVQTGVESVGVIANNGLDLFERRTLASFGLTVTNEDAGSGRVENAARSIDDLDLDRLSASAMATALRTCRPTPVAPGSYAVIFAPAASAAILASLAQALEAHATRPELSPLAVRPDEPLIDPRLTLRNFPTHPGLLGVGFDDQGVISDSHAWITRGVYTPPKRRKDAQQQSCAARLDAPQLAAEANLPFTPTSRPASAPTVRDADPWRPAGMFDTLDALIADTPRGLLVTNLWYVRTINPRDLTLAGVTRAGVLRIEDGKLAGGVGDFRWQDSPLRILNAVSGLTRPVDACLPDLGRGVTKLAAPALRVERFAVRGAAGALL